MKVSKNIHVLSTDKPSRLVKNGKGLLLVEIPKSYTFFGNNVSTNIYITNDEEIKEGDWCYQPNLPNLLEICKNREENWMIERGFKKIILTTDQDLIKNGVQSIDDDFLEWFVNNPSCEFVNIVPFDGYNAIKGRYFGYEIIIPKEEPKQEIDFNRFNVIFEQVEPMPITDAMTQRQNIFKKYEDAGIKVQSVCFPSDHDFFVEKKESEVLDWLQNTIHSEHSALLQIKQKYTGDADLVSWNNNPMQNQRYLETNGGI
jgi:hypothetical protein